MVMGHLLTPLDNLQEILLGIIDFSWFIDSSYSEGDNDKYCAGYVIATPFDVVTYGYFSPVVHMVTQK